MSATNRRSRRMIAAAVENLELRVMLSAYDLSALATLHGSNGANPVAALTEVGGNFYGTSEGGGSAGDGTVFEYNPSANSCKALVSFTGANGSQPRSTLLDVGGNLYGTTQVGGPGGDGIIFEFHPATNTLTTLANFHGSNGADPVAGLIAMGGNFYGTTEDGGSAGDGTIFEYNTSTNTQSVLATFHQANGANPEASLLDVGGNLYGTTFAGGTNSQGTIFEYNTSTKDESVIATFHGSNGAQPKSNLIDVGGNLYGTTYSGGNAGDGVVFEYNTSTKQDQTLANFVGSNGSSPTAGLVADSSGDLFGTTEIGGSANDGIAFEYTAASKSLSTIATFHGSNGADPQSALIAVGSDFYGTSAGGGYLTQGNTGTVFEISVDPIEVKYLALGGSSGKLGQSTSAELSLNGGLYETYQHGAIFWSASTGAHDVSTATEVDYLTTANEKDFAGNSMQKDLGFPISDESAVSGISGATVTEFNGGAIYNSAATGAHAILSTIQAKYVAIDGPAALGLPTTDEATTPDGAGRDVHFQSVNGKVLGAIDWTPTYGANAVEGAIAAEFKTAGWEKIGEATTDEININSSTYNAAYNRFATLKPTTVSGKTVDVELKTSAINFTSTAGASLSAGPKYNDITQGDTGTCWIDSAISALQYSGDDLTNIIHYVGNNNYDVDLYNWNDPSERPGGGMHKETEVVNFNGSVSGSDLNFNPSVPSGSWALILQRAVIQAVHDWDPTQTILMPHSGGAGDPMSILTGQPFTTLATWGTGAQSALESALSKKEAVVLNTNPSGTKTLVSDHDYVVLSANSSGVSLYNPWNSMITVSWSVIASDGETIFAV